MTGRLPSLKSRDVIRALERAGFSVTRTAGSHCRLVHDMDPSRQVTVRFTPARTSSEEPFKASFGKQG